MVVMQMSTQLIKLEGASKSYLNKGFDLEIEKGDFIVLSGENGSGKSTLLKLILGLIRPDSGKVSRDEKLRISYLPEISELPHYIKGFEYLNLIAKIKKSELNVNDVLKFKVPIYKELGTLSKGNRQKVSLISSLLGNSDLLVLDEPLSGLDKEASNVLLDELIKKKIEGTCVVISTHNPTFFSKLSTKMVEL
jgi:ABC-type multidrug transport system ATPase subunit